MSAFRSTDQLREGKATMDIRFKAIVFYEEEIRVQKRLEICITFPKIR